MRRPAVLFNEYDRETLRVTAFGELDFREKDGWLRHLGRHRFTGLYNDYTLKTHSSIWRDAWSSDAFDILTAQYAPTINHDRRDMNTIVHTSSSLLGLTSMDDIRLSQIQIARPQPGDTYNVLDAGPTTGCTTRSLQTGEVYVDRYLDDENISRTSIQAQAISWRSYFLGDHIVGLWGFRKDDTKSYARATLAEAGVPQRLSDGRWNPEFSRLSAAPSLDESGDTMIWSVVARYSKKWQGGLPWGLDLRLHYAESENFNPIGLRSDVLGQPIGQPTGTTKEYGFMLSTADNRFSAKFNWFETNLKDVNANPSVGVPSEACNRITAFRDAELAGVPFANALITVQGDPAAFPIQDYDTFYSLMEGAVPEALRNNVNPRRVDTDDDSLWDTMEWDSVANLKSTQDFVSEGFEVELVANPLPGWRILGNISQQQAVRSNIATSMAEVVEEFNQVLQSTRMGELRGLDANQTAQVRSINDTWLTGSLAPVRAAKALENTVAKEQREWRFSLVSTYRFREGLLKGVSVGGAARWEDEAATGYVYYVEPQTNVPIPDVSRPYYDNGLFSGDLWLSYERKVWNDKANWKDQLNIRNAFGDREDIPVKINPDGQVAVVRMPNPRVFSLTNTFRFQAFRMNTHSRVPLTGASIPDRRDDAPNLSS